MSLNNTAAALDDLPEEGLDEANIGFINEPQLVVLGRRPADNNVTAPRLDGNVVTVTGSLSISF